MRDGARKWKGPNCPLISGDNELIVELTSTGRVVASHLSEIAEVLDCADKNISFGHTKQVSILQLTLCTEEFP